MAETLNVEYDELLKRAKELEAPLPAIPTTDPTGPCTLSFVNDAATQLAMSTESVRQALKSCEREWTRLATSLRNAAKAYGEVDEGSAAAIANAKSSNGAAATRGKDELSAVAEERQQSGGIPRTERVQSEASYYDVKDAATILESGDQGAALKAFANEWDVFQRALQLETSRFRRFDSWQGEARDKVEQNFEAQSRWISSMVQSCRKLAAQALQVVGAHKKACVGGQVVRDVTGGGTGSVATEHPTLYEVTMNEWWYQYYAKNDPKDVGLATQWHQRLQTRSETSLSEYAKNVALEPVTPTFPDRGTVIDPPTKTNPGSDDSNFDDKTLPNPNDLNAVPPITRPTPPDTQLADALNGLKAGAGLPKGGMKPASLGGGAGLPLTPMDPATEAGAGSRPGGAAPGAGALGRGLPNAGGAMGGMPLGAPGAGNQNQGKDKRAQQDEEALYTEDRAWTEGVIGRRRAKDASDK
ncbi:PPE domain-containing protein [Mycobacterium sp. 050134]|uniref:PPE domain-containing protein n=1 Tax=Mycobacterium sp. 050134 TaxID=3096111 RepID=UPI002EDA36F7